MATYIDQNFGFQSLAFLQDGDICIRGNYNQATPTEITAAIEIHGGNWVNVKPINATIVVPGNHSQKDYCYWQHLPDDAENMNYINLPVEVDNCRHVIDTDTITIDGQTFTEYIRDDTVLPKWSPS